MPMKLAQKLAVNYLRARLNFLAVLSKKKAAKKAYQIFCTPYYKSKKETPAIFKTAFPLSINVKGTTVRGYRWNEGGIKRVLILHGFESSVKNFDAYIAELIQKNYEVLAFDAPAHGISGGKYITLPLYIDMINAVYYKFGTIQSFMAHSFGGLALIHFIEKIPTDANTKLVLIAPATESRTAINSFFKFLQLGKEVKKEFEKILVEKAGVDLSYYSIPRALKNIKASVLWVHDKNDDITPFRDAEPVIKENYANISFYITQGLGHKKIYRDSSVLQRIIDFL
jgi:esterase/lipase